jgi:flagellar basal-body rod protein FlgB
MAWLDRRAAVLAENIANADTPGWKSRDLKPFSAALDAAAVTPLRTSPMHLAGTVQDDAANPASAGERAPDGNTVRVDVEMTRLADTETAQALVSNLWKSYVGMFRTALGK